jgi:hypothetical protein
MTWAPFFDEPARFERSTRYTPVDPGPRWRPGRLIPGDPAQATTNLAAAAARWDLAPDRFWTEDECQERCDELNRAELAGLASEQRSQRPDLEGSA